MAGDAAGAFTFFWVGDEAGSLGAFEVVGETTGLNPLEGVAVALLRVAVFALGVEAVVDFRGVGFGVALALDGVCGLSSFFTGASLPAGETFAGAPPPITVSLTASLTSCTFDLSVSVTLVGLSSEEVGWSAEPFGVLCCHIDSVDGTLSLGVLLSRFRFLHCSLLHLLLLLYRSQRSRLPRSFCLLVTYTRSRQSRTIQARQTGGSFGRCRLGADSFLRPREIRT